MATPTRKAVLSAAVRIDSTNKTIRAKINGATSTYTLTEGTRYFGIDGVTSGNDTLFFGATTLLTHFDAVIGLKPRIYHGASPSGITATTTYGGTGGAGHVALDPVLATDMIYWDHAETTIDPRWFGRYVSGGTYGAWGASSTAVEDGSTYASSAVFVGDVQIRDDRHIEEIRQQKTKADSGKIHTVYYGASNSRYLEFRVSGIPREDADTSYHALRRFIRTLRTGQPFAYFPDISIAPTTVWLPDSSLQTERYGPQFFCLSPRNGTIQWDDAPLYPGYYQHWVKGFYVDEVVA